VRLGFEEVHRGRELVLSCLANTICVLRPRFISSCPPSSAESDAHGGRCPACRSP
jgi:hypothetical protein